MASNLTVFSADSCIVYNTKKGDVVSTSPEGALFKGAAALASLKDVALDSAITKALNGRYQVAVDVLGASFPKVAKATNDLLGLPGLNKANFTAFLRGIDRCQAPAKGFSKKQVVARSVAIAILAGMGLATETDVNTVEMVEAT